MSKLRIYGDTSGYVDFNVPAVAGTTTININKLLEADSSGNITLTGNLEHSGNFILDVGGDITLDAGGGDILLKDDGAHWASIYTNGTNTYIQNMVNSGDLYLAGKDGSGNGVNALVIDMSAGGNVGIGTTTPAGLLSLSKGVRTLDIKLESSPASGDMGIQLRGSSGDYIGIAGDTGVGIVVTNTNLVGIGTEAPGATFDVNGTLQTKEQLLSAISKDISTTALDVFVYDTSRDTDGGAWRHRTENTSWYNETLNTSTRGSRREFPSMAVIVATTNEVTIYDGDDPDLPMWMKFPANGIIDWPTSNQSQLAVSAVQGQIAMVGNDGGIIAKFIVDYVDILYSSKNYPIRTSRSIAGRGDTTSYVTNSGQAVRTYSVSHYDMNDVAMTVLSNAKIDPQTGIAQPTTAVATRTGGSAFTDDGNYTAYTKGTSAAEVIKCCWMGDNLVLQAPLYYGIYKDPFVNESASYVGNISDVNYYFDDQAGVYSSPSPIGDVDEIVEMDNITILSRSIGATNSQAGITIHETDSRDLVNQSNTGMACYINSTFNTGWLNGRIKLATCSDTDSNNAVGGNLLTNSGSGNWSASQGSFSWSGGAITTAVASTVNQDITTVVGKTYVAMLTWDSGNGGGNNQGLTFGGISDFNSTTSGRAQVTFKATTTTTTFTLFSGSGTSATFRNLTVTLGEDDRSGSPDSPDRGVQVFGTVTKNPVATGTDLVSYSGFSTSNYLRQPYNSELSFNAGNGFGIYGWFKHDTTNNGSYRTLVYRNSVGSVPAGFQVLLNPQGELYYFLYGSSTSMSCQDSVGSDDNVWHMFYARTTAANSHQLWIDGLLRASNSNNIGNITNTAAELYLGVYAGSASLAYPWAGGHMSNMRFTDRPATEDQIRKMYHDEKHNYQPQAKATLYGSSDVVTAIAYDKPKKEIHAGTSAGRSVIKGVTRISNTTDAITQRISASNGFVAEE